eukprot:COSAG05_NODE_872_length_6839_cov_16.232938_4_plen_226_part_00
MELPSPEDPPSFQRAQNQRSIADQEEEAIRRIEAGRPPVLAARQLTNSVTQASIEKGAEEAAALAKEAAALPDPEQEEEQGTPADSSAAGACFSSLILLSGCTSAVLLFVCLIDWSIDFLMHRVRTSVRASVRTWRTCTRVARSDGAAGARREKIPAAAKAAAATAASRRKGGNAGQQVTLSFASCTMRAELTDHFQPCMTDIDLHIDARTADYIRTHPYHGFLS